MHMHTHTEWERERERVSQVVKADTSEQNQASFASMCLSVCLESGASSLWCSSIAQTRSLPSKTNKGRATSVGESQGICTGTNVRLSWQERWESHRTSLTRISWSSFSQGCLCNCRQDIDAHRCSAFPACLALWSISDLHPSEVPSKKGGSQRTALSTQHTEARTHTQRHNLN